MHDLKRTHIIVMRNNFARIHLARMLLHAVFVCANAQTGL
jgi:hypothetical protein